MYPIPTPTSLPPFPITPTTPVVRPGATTLPLDSFLLVLIPSTVSGEEYGGRKAEWIIYLPFLARIGIRYLT